MTFFEPSGSRDHVWCRVWVEFRSSSCACFRLVSRLKSRLSRVLCGFSSSCGLSVFARGTDSESNRLTRLGIVWITLVFRASVFVHDFLRLAHAHLDARADTCPDHLFLYSPQLLFFFVIAPDCFVPPCVLIKPAHTPSGAMTLFTGSLHEYYFSNVK